MGQMMVLIFMQFWYSTRLKRMSGNKYQRCILALYGQSRGWFFSKKGEEKRRGGREKGEEKGEGEGKEGNLN